MNLQELCEEINMSENTLKTCYNKTVDSLRRNRGIIITKTGRGASADYQLQYDESQKEEKTSRQKIHTELIGARFGHLTVIKDSGERKHRSVVWECQCDCGRKHKVSRNHLKANSIKSCGDPECPYHKRYDDLTNKQFGLLKALYPTTMKDGSHMYWMCQCDCGKQKEVASNHLKNNNIRSCGCIKKSIGEMNIENILQQENIEYQTQYSFNDLKNVSLLRFDFAIFSKEHKLDRLIEFDGIQHYEEQNFFSHSLTENKNNDKIKNEYCKNNNIPLVRIPYWERDNITLEMLLGKEYLVNE